MKKQVYLNILFLLIFPVFSLKAQVLIPNHSVTGNSYAGTKVNRIYIPPPKSFLTKSDSKGGGKVTVIYSGFSSEPKAAVEYAVKILESMLPADFKLTIKASWTKISTQGVLGNSSATSYVAGWYINAFEPKAAYPVGLAEKIAGRNLNEDSEADIELSLNSDDRKISWYFGTDGNTPVSKYDLVTVVLHELCHGLGFFDSMWAENGVGTYGRLIYDRFVENLSGKRLTDTTLFLQNSAELYDELVSGQLYFGGPLTRRYLSGNRARLFSPATWDPGSSVSHLDETRTLASDALMTPYIDLGEAIHDPGNLTFSILGDLGWINTRVVPIELKDTEAHLSEIKLDVSILSDTTYDKNRIGVVYSFDNFSSSDTLIMSTTSSDDSYSGLIHVPSYNSKLDYYFFAIDDFSRIYNSPSLAGKRPYTVFIGTDTVKPIILHTPAEYYFEKIDSLILRANVDDNLGVDTVFIEYNVNSGPAKYSGMTPGHNNEYSLRLAMGSELLKGGDILNYRIIAVDRASGRNTGIAPSSGYFEINIESLLPAVTSYFTDFTNSTAEFFNSGFEIAQPDNFTSPALHSEHPYKSPEEDDKSLEFSSVLRHPVIFNSSGMIISLKELVLVEPGAEGSVFGFSDFYDYVIIEASKDFGMTWFSLADGYDARIVPSWETAYNSTIDGQNSTYAGKESMMLEHSFYPRISDWISDGDTLLIRFRLFSDPYANGWGWVIDDLKINPLVDQVEEKDAVEIKIYPNPGHGHVTIIFDDDYTSAPATINVYNFAGKSIIRETYYGEKMVTLDVSGSPPGIYFFVINYGQITKTVIYSLVK